MTEHPPNVSVIITVNRCHANQFSDWISVTTNQQLLDLTNFPSANTEILMTCQPGATDYCLNWLEIGDPSTSHHYHDMDQRIRLMQKWLDQQSDDFQFDNDWIKRSINWSNM